MSGMIGGGSTFGGTKCTWLKGGTKWIGLTWWGGAGGAKRIGLEGGEKSRDRPKTKREKNDALKSSFALPSKHRVLIECVQCHKKRVIYSEKKL